MDMRSHTSMMIDATITNGRHGARASIIRPLLVALLATFIIGLTALTGIERGMDHKVAYGPWAEQRAMSIALSESAYGLRLGYVGLRSVNDKLVEI